MLIGLPLVLPLSPFHILTFLFPAVHYNTPCLYNAPWEHKEAESDPEEEVKENLIMSELGDDY